MKKRRPLAALERKVANIIAPCQQPDRAISGREIIPETSDKGDFLTNKTALTKPLALADRFRELLGLIEQLYALPVSPQAGNAPLTTEPE